MENGKITESKITDAFGLTESREFPELRKEKQSISLFGSRSGFYVLKNGKLYTYVNDKTDLILLADDVQSAAGGLDCCVYINKKGNAFFLNNGSKTDILDSLSNIKYVVSDGKENFYLIDSSGQTFCFNTKAKQSKKVLDKELCLYDDYSEMLTATSKEVMLQLRSRKWAEYWIKETSFYKDAVEQYGKENVGFKIYESSRNILSDTPLKMQAYITISFSVFTVRDERVSPIVRSEEKIYIPEEDTAVYVENGMYTDASDTELFISCPVKKMVYIAGETAAEKYSAFSSVRVVNAITKKPRIINKGLMLQKDGTLQVFESFSHRWKNTSFPIKNICDIALFGTDNEYVAVSKTNGEIIITQYSTLLKYELGSFISIIRTPEFL